MKSLQTICSENAHAKFGVPCHFSHGSVAKKINSKLDRNQISIIIKKKKTLTDTSITAKYFDSVKQQSNMPATHSHGSMGYQIIFINFSSAQRETEKIGDLFLTKTFCICLQSVSFSFCGYTYESEYFFCEFFVLIFYPGGNTWP